MDYPYVVFATRKQLTITTMNIFKRTIVFTIFLLAATEFSVAQNPADRILGTYYVIEPSSKEESKVQIYKTDKGTYFGKVIWMKNPNMPDGTPKRDIKNPDPAKRNTPADQIPMLFHFKYDAKKKEWIDGEIYDPVHGKYYKCKMWFSDDKTLQLRGYIGIPALGRTMTWKKL